MKSEIIVLQGAKHLKIKSTCDFVSNKFKNGETCFKLNCSLRYKPVTIIQSFPETNDNLMELMLAVDACRRSGAMFINTILTIFPYARQDRLTKSGVPISASVVCNMIASAGANRVISIDLHNDAIQGMMPNNVIFDHIDTTAFLSYHLKKNISNIREWTFVSPDAGAIKRVKKLADMCGVSNLVIIDKTRTQASIVDEVRLIGNVQYKSCIVVDDICDSGGTLSNVVDELMNRGAYEAKLVVTHGIFSTPAYYTLDGLDVTCTNTLPIADVDSDGNKCIQGINVYEIEPFLKDLIMMIDNGLSLGPLFSDWKEKEN